MEKNQQELLMAVNDSRMKDEQLESAMEITFITRYMKTVNSEKELRYTIRRKDLAQT